MERLFYKSHALCEPLFKCLLPSKFIFPVAEWKALKPLNKLRLAFNTLPKAPPPTPKVGSSLTTDPFILKKHIIILVEPYASQ